MSKTRSKEIIIGRKVWLFGRCPMYVTGVFTTLSKVLDGDMEKGDNTVLYLDFPENEGDVLEVDLDEVTLEEVK